MDEPNPKHFRCSLFCPLAQELYTLEGVVPGSVYCRLGEYMEDVGAKCEYDMEELEWLLPKLSLAVLIRQLHRRHYPNEKTEEE